MNEKGFSLIEVLVSIGILAVVLLSLGSFIFELKYTNYKSKADTQALDNAKSALDAISREIKGAKSIYIPTTTSNQLSLETSSYLPDDESDTFIDFFLCGTALCLKKESQSPVALTSDTVDVTALQFTQVVNGSNSSIKINLTVSSKNPSNDLSRASLVNLTSTVSLRNY